MSEEHSCTWTRTSRVIRAQPKEVYATFLDPAALIEWLLPGEMTSEIHEFDARGRRRVSHVAVLPAG